jgi:hypothetical protein
MGYNQRVGIESLLGKTLTAIGVEKTNDDYILFYTSDGKVYKMYHSQDCCESVSIEDIEGDIQDLIGSPITQAEESTSDTYNGSVQPEYDSETWTFYKLATVKGYVTIRWYGTSNGYYSESVDFEDITEGEDQY